MPLILDKNSDLWSGNPALGAITAYSFDSAEVEGAEPSVQVALVGWWLIADGGHIVQPGFWTFTGGECEEVATWCKAIHADRDWGNFGLMALADLLWSCQTDEAKEAFADAIPLDLPTGPEEDDEPLLLIDSKTGEFSPLPEGVTIRPEGVTIGREENVLR